MKRKAKVKRNEGGDVHEGEAIRVEGPGQREPGVGVVAGVRPADPPDGAVEAGRERAEEPARGGDVPLPTVPVDDFDETTPPPRRRPLGPPIPQFVALPPGESVVGWFAAMDAQGRVPAGSFLAHRRGNVLLIDPAKSGWVVVALPHDHGTTHAAEVPATVDRDVPPAKLEPYMVRATVRAKGSGDFVIFSPMEDARG